MHVNIDAEQHSKEPPSWYKLWSQYVTNLWKLEEEAPDQPLSDYMFSFDGFRNNYHLLTDRKDTNLCLPPRLYRNDQERPKKYVPQFTNPLSTA